MPCHDRAGAEAFGWRRLPRHASQSDRAYDVARQVEQQREPEEQHQAVQIERRQQIVGLNHRSRSRPWAITLRRRRRLPSCSVLSDYLRHCPIRLDQEQRRVNSKNYRSMAREITSLAKALRITYQP